MLTAQRVIIATVLAAKMWIRQLLVDSNGIEFWVDADVSNQLITGKRLHEMQKRENR